MRSQSIISLDPIDRRKKEQGILSKLLKTRWIRGQSIVKNDRFGHYLFCGEQGSGKTASALWYAERLQKKYEKLSFIKRKVLKKKPKKVLMYSNIGIGKPIEKKTLFDTINNFPPSKEVVRIVIIDEIHTYFPKDMYDSETKRIKNDLIAIFSQLRKRSTYILSTSQIYGRLDKSLREQCLFMIDNQVTISNKIKSSFIPQKDILCDDLGRWAGIAQSIYVHGLSKLDYDTYKIIKD